MDLKYNRNSISKSVLGAIKEQNKGKVAAKVDLKDDKELAAWFMGTRGENLQEVKKMIASALDSVLEGRKKIFPKDPDYITDEIKNSKEYKEGISSVKKHTKNLQKILNDYSLPTQSLRYQGHMLWDITLPSLIGYFSAMLENQNNVTSQASPATTILELLVCNDIAQMAGFNVKEIDDNNPDPEGRINAWAHISSGGSAANIESLWAARELKFLPLGIKYALNEGESLNSIAGLLRLHPNDVSSDLFIKASIWELMNLEHDEILKFPEEIWKLINQVENVKDKIMDLAGVWHELISCYSLNSRGFQFFNQEYLQKEDIKMPTMIVPSTKHYSWVKAASILGFGIGQTGLSETDLSDINKIKNDGLINVYVDPDGSVNTDLLNDVLKTCKKGHKPVVMVVSVMGTTEEGTVDPLEKILKGRNDFREDKEEPFEYSIHADAAWGGYFLSCLRNEFEMEVFPTKKKKSEKGGTEIFDNKDSWLRDSVYDSMIEIRHCDSATIDPHKMGYIPYPAGSLIYRNDKIINLISFTAPYINSGITSKDEINTRKIGECGIEGSKPGAAPASVYLSHMVIRPDKRGYGRIINQSMLNSKLFYLYLLTMKWKYPDDNFEIVMFNKPPMDKDTDKEFLLKDLWENNYDSKELTENSKIRELLKNIAGDQNIVDYIIIDKKDKTFQRTKKLNEKVCKELSLIPGDEVKDDQVFVSSTTFCRKDYGPTFIKTLAKRIYDKEKVKIEEIEEIPCIRSVIMDPWAIFTHGGNNHNFFTEIFIPKLRKVVQEIY